MQAILIRQGTGEGRSAMRCYATLFGGLICLLGASAHLATAADVRDFIDFSLRGTTGNLLLPGRLYVPPEAANPQESRPLILFLHGAGESGTNNLLQINSNMDNLLAEAKQRGAYLYAPQTTSNNGWSETIATDRTMEMVQRALSDHNVDSTRLYVTGLSMGGGGVWNMLHRYPDRFAAAVPICAVSPASGFLSANMFDDAIWAFHARNDPTVLVSSTRNIISGIERAAREPVPTYPPQNDTSTLFHFDSQQFDVHYTELPTGGHVIWSSVYAHEPMYDWLFAHAIVPEPSSIGLIAIAGMVLAPRRQRRQSASR
jgi:predicted peptidase